MCVGRGCKAMHRVTHRNSLYNYLFSSANFCARKAADVLDGRRSFPSGHSSTAFAGMTFFFLWISAQTAAWTLARPLPTRKSYLALLNSRSTRAVISLAPLSFATWVAVSRIEDYVRVLGEIYYYSYGNRHFNTEAPQRGRNCR